MCTLIPPKLIIKLLGCGNLKPPAVKSRHRKEPEEEGSSPFCKDWLQKPAFLAEPQVTLAVWLHLPDADLATTGVICILQRCQW